MNHKNITVLELDMHRNITGGSEDMLLSTVKNAADLRIYTEFRHNEHIDTSSDNNELIKEVSDFPAAYVIEDRWVAAMMTLRQPVTLPDRFGDPSMSYFMYNQNGMQAVARPYLEGGGSYECDEDPETPWNGGGEPKPMIHMHEGVSSERIQNALWNNFVYDFYSYKFFAQDNWTEVFSHDKDGKVISGSARALEEASENGCDIKVAIDGICEGVFGAENTLKHEVFIGTGPHYYYTETGFMVAETRPFIRVVPEIPMVYRDHNWDFGWAIVRSDGHVAGLWYDPYTLRYKRTYTRHAMRWFVKYN